MGNGRYSMVQQKEMVVGEELEQNYPSCYLDMLE